MTPLEVGPIAGPVAPTVAPDAAAVEWSTPAALHEGPQAAMVQSAAVRPPTTTAELPKSADTLLPRATHDLAEFALPAAQLSPALLIGLQVEAGHGWPLFHPGGAPAPEPRPAEEAESDSRRRKPASPEPEDGSADAAAAPAEAPAPASEGSTAAAPLEAIDADWCDTLALALREALAGRVPPQPLLAAVPQWARGRCIVLACPQGADPEGPAWAFVLWPRRAPAAAGAGAAAGRAVPPLKGLRVEARLHWWTPAHAVAWRHVRVVKEHHPRHGRQLVPCDGADASGHVPCAVQLGPVLARSVHGCDVGLRIDAVQRFWNALGTQWSVHVVVSALPLAGVREMPQEVTPC